MAANKGFQRSTRLRRIRLPTLTRPGGGGLQSIDLPKVGLLYRLYLVCTGSVAGALSLQNQYGFSSVINNLRLAINSGLDLINITGPGYAWLLRDFVDLFFNVSPENTGRSAVTAAAFNMDMLLPVSLNNRDETGLVLLQNEQTLVTLYVNWEADTTVATGATVTATLEPVMEYFEIPSDPRDMPDLSTLHTIREDKTTIAGAGDVTYNWPRGNIYAGMYHLIGTTTWSRAILRAQQGNNIIDDDNGSHQMVFNALHYSDANLTGGAITGSNKRVLWDLLGSDGLGAYGSVRDFIDSSKLTDLASVITVAGAGEVRSMRRELIPLKS